MPRLASFVSIAAVIVIGAWALWETKALAETAGQHEMAARNLRAELAVKAAKLAAAEIELAAAGKDGVAYAQLRLELSTAQSQLAAVTALLEQRNAEAQQRVEAAAAESERAAKGLPEGVRLCLEALHECLRAEGFSGQRFLAADKVEDRALVDVELIDSAADGLLVAFVRAARMTAMLDRGAGRLELRFEDGYRAVGGTRTPLPKDGWVLRFDDVDGRLFEARLPYLVRAEGVYPEIVTPLTRLPTDVDPFTRRQWQRRLDDTFVLAGLPETWRVTHFRGMQDGWFLAMDLVASDAQHRVVGGAHCERFAIEVDAASGVVSLRMLEGVLLRDGAESSIRGEGYRMLLPKLTPEQASRAMQGMVVTK